VDDDEVLPQPSADVLNARPPKSGIFDWACFWVDCKHGIPRVRSIDGDCKTALRNTVNRSKRVEDDIGDFGGSAELPSIFVGAKARLAAGWRPTPPRLDREKHQRP
jgi:hypothetical protein